MTKAVFLKIANMVFDIGESADHFVNLDFDTNNTYLQLYVFNKTEDGGTSGIADNIVAYELNEEVVAFISRWTETIRKERVLNGTH